MSQYGNYPLKTEVRYLNYCRTFLMAMELGRYDVAEEMANNLYLLDSDCDKNIREVGNYKSEK